MSLLDEIIFYPKIISEDELIKINEIIWDSKWGFQKSNYHDKHSFLQMILDDNLFFKESLFEKIKLNICSNFKINKVYANGQYFGMPGQPHHDNCGDQFYTFLIYANEVWDVVWGGQTVFFDSYVNDQKQTITVSNNILVKYPEPGCGVLFPSKLIHFAESPTKDCFDFRFTIAYKLERIL